jgi:hypothetical protein
MQESTKSQSFSPRASLAALGLVLQQKEVFKPIQDRVVIAQKTVKHTPIQKLYDAFITILAGGVGLVEVNTRLRSDPALQQAFGRCACAEQSVVQQTLWACDEHAVAQMQVAWTQIYQRHSQGFCQDYTSGFQLLDVDMTGNPCGKKAEFATRGYFARQRNRCARQIGRVLATHYGEIVADRLFDGGTPLAKALVPLVLAAQETLELTQARRARTIVRVDGGGGSLEDVNWLLLRGYQLHGKEYPGKRTRRLCSTVTEWFEDPTMPKRQVGWVTEPAGEYIRPVVRIAVRCRKKNGQWGEGVLISTLCASEVLSLTKVPAVSQDLAALLAYVYFYDARSGGVELSFTDDKHGLGLTRRNKQRFAAQQMVSYLCALAHNVLVWARRWLCGAGSVVKRFGILRLVRDVFHISGFVRFDAPGRVQSILLNEAAPLAGPVGEAFRRLLQAER